MEDARGANGRTRYLDWLVVGLPVGLLYLVTGARDLGTIDSGELAVVCARLGIAHPTGYSLYTLLGRAMTLLIPGPPIVAVILLSTLLATVATVLVAGIAREVGEGIGIPVWLGWIAALWFATDRIFWDQATGNEVYAFHVFFVALLSLLGLRFLRRGGSGRTLLLLGYTAGLSFAHHLSIVFLAPALLFALLRGLPEIWTRRGGSARRHLLAAFALALLGWSVVLYLPIRSARGPVLDWGAPDTWARFWRHALAAQYRVWIFESGSLWGRQLAHFLGSLPWRLSWPVLLLAVPGAVDLARRAPWKAVFLGLVLVSTAVWASSYDIHDLAPYYLPTDLSLVLFAAAGGGAVLRWGRGHGDRRGRLLSGLVAAGLTVIGLGQGSLHFARADQRGDHLIRAHAEAVLRSAPPRAILFSRHWDAFVSPSLYLQGIDGQRPDVIVVDTELLRRAWYYPQLDRLHPGLLDPIRKEVAAFLEQVALFDAGKPYDPQRIEKCYQALIYGLAHSHQPDRPTAFTPDAPGTFFGSQSPVPEGLVYVLKDDPSQSPDLKPPSTDTLLRSGLRLDDPIHSQVVHAWRQMITARLRYLEAYGRTEEMAPWQAAGAGLAALRASPDES